MLEVSHEIKDLIEQYPSVLHRPTESTNDTLNIALKRNVCNTSFNHESESEYKSYKHVAKPFGNSYRNHKNVENPIG